MKNIFSAIVIVLSCNAFSQVIIGDALGTATSKTSVLLEFAKGQNKGIILPYVTSHPTGAALVGGAIVLDATDATKAKVQYFNDTNWVDLSSGDEANVTGAVALQPQQPTILNPPVEDISAKAIIGASSSTAEGVLVLESSSKAMILPIVKSTDDILSPAPGMMVYVDKSGARRLAVFNGANWTYWKS